MGVDNLDKLFSPRTIAVVGASDRKGSIGRAVLANLIQGGYAGRIFPVNPNHPEIQGLPACAALDQLPQQADLVVFVVPIALVPGMLADAAPQAVIVTGGTGVSPKDVTIEALRPLMSKELTAFGPIFAHLSYQEIGSAAIMSRATAGVIGHCLVFCLPGSLKACQLACSALIFPELGHLRVHVQE